MCSACLATAALIAIGATGTGGLTVLAVKTFGHRPAVDILSTISKPKEDRHG